MLAQIDPTAYLKVWHTPAVIADVVVHPRLKTEPRLGSKDRKVLVPRSRQHVSTSPVPKHAGVGYLQPCAHISACYVLQPSCFLSRASGWFSRDHPHNCDQVVGGGRDDLPTSFGLTTTTWHLPWHGVHAGTCPSLEQARTLARPLADWTCTPAPKQPASIVTLGQGPRRMRRNSPIDSRRYCTDRRHGWPRSVGTEGEERSRTSTRRVFLNSPSINSCPCVLQGAGCTFAGRKGTSQGRRIISDWSLRCALFRGGPSSLAQGSL